MKKVKFQRLTFECIPFRVILDILNNFFLFVFFFLCRLWEFYGKFKYDFTKRVFPLFRTLFIQENVEFDNLPVSRIIMLFFNDYTEIPLSFIKRLQSIQVVHNVSILENDLFTLNHLTRMNLRELSIWASVKKSFKDAFNDISRFSSLEKLRLQISSNSESFILNCSNFVMPKLTILRLDGIEFSLQNQCHFLLEKVDLVNIEITQQNLLEIYFSPKLRHMELTYCVIYGDISFLIKSKEWKLLRICECENNNKKKIKHYYVKK